MSNKNTEIRREILGAGLRFWQVAAKLGISDDAFSKKLRFELNDEEKNQIREIIKELQIEEGLG